jgi:ethanolamine utilization protein EutQ
VKTLISVNEIKSLASAGKKVLYIEPGTIVTYAARDTANDLGISLKSGSAPEGQEVCCAPVKNIEAVSSESVVSSVNPEMISRIVMEVMVKLPQFLYPGNGQRG